MISLTREDTGRSTLLSTDGNRSWRSTQHFKEGNKARNLQVGSGQWAKWKELQEGKGGERKKEIPFNPSHTEVYLGKGTKQWPVEEGTLSTAHWGDQAQGASLNSPSLKLNTSRKLNTSSKYSDNAESRERKSFL